MPRRIMLVPVGFGVGLTSSALGLYHKLQQLGVDVGYFKPITQPSRNVLHGDTQAAPDLANIQEHSIPISVLEEKVGDDKLDVVLEEIVANFERFDNDIIVIEGMIKTTKHTYAARINAEVAQALSADIIFVTTPDNDTPERFEDRLEVSAKTFGGIKNPRVKGCIINKINAPNKDVYGLLPRDSEFTPSSDVSEWLNLRIFKTKAFQLIGAIPWDMDLVAPRVAEIAKYLEATVLNEGDLEHRRVRSISFCARSVANLMSHLEPNRLIVTPGDRTDIIIATCLSALNGTKISALLLTNGYKPNDAVWNLCQQALQTGLTVLSVDWDTWETSRHLMGFNPEIPEEDIQRQDRVKHFVADHLKEQWLTEFIGEKITGQLLSPPAFRHKLTTLAKKADKLIVLPEGNEVRTVKAAAICAERGIARCQLLGNHDEILRVAEQQGIDLPDGVMIIDPEVIRENYVNPLLALRKHKGMTDIIAREELKDNTVLATMMLQLGQVDGLVSGAVNTTANTIRPALQLIKTAPGNSLVSSVFFMLLPDQVFVYGDCAINPDPNAEQLADIAIQSADSAVQFGIEPRVAMISYSTGSSGSGVDVEKVSEATKLAQQKRPDLLIDGPLQYDAAVMKNVAVKKAPNSKVAGQATVFVFPDLNTGNTTYKAVQRSADLISIGPMLQGLNKPVNDLSRGALVDDIVYTIALTAIQADQQ
ncbi:phosphate acetyltransferase [Thalassotalea ponticola]|uniref:phosphate acetyltransferase n=1 Tax=Thalassotalea ponticola TaxID=1523392 RepID=UPI0025B2D3DA|nr:phosphate acetyltransferase [Thalassotalea ponticola]MDN3651233.1 phosphate acetyltransferase [Thalassotalea ponticola]